MANDRDVPDIVVGRLPVYLRTLSAMLAAGQHLTSSQELASALDLSSAQIRKDLSHFGEFGKQGTGYNVQRLVDQLRDILKLEREWPLVLIGAGHIGSAVANYTGFAHRGFQLVAVIDADPGRIGQQVGGHSIQPLAALDDVVRQHRVQHALIAVPATAAQAVAEAVVAAGVRAILNYAPVALSVPAGVHVEYIDPVLHLQRMTYYL
jgi:redox-sensing transcriptional repressor